jgi:hypothetical protein
MTNWKGDAEFWSISLNMEDSKLGSGDKGNVKLWDVRSTSQLHMYPDFHQDDITQVYSAKFP